MDRAMTVTPIGPGLYRVSDGVDSWTVAVAGPPEDRWVWVDGQVARLEPPMASAKGRTRPKRGGSHDLSAPMPATVVRVDVEPGTQVKRGATLVVLEAMKMEMPIRAPRDAVVKAVRCQLGDLVQAGVELVELEE
jgi:3-methylcrotonyl-CoA carboxylase alpha subunit